MHATHQFFLTKRSLYLLVLDARSSEEQNRLEYWLKIIGSFGGESPVIVVGNKLDLPPGLRQRISVKTLLNGIESEAQRRGGLGRESRREELQQLIWINHRRLQKLKEEEALKGKAAGLSLEIEDIEIEIEKLQMELKTIE